MPFNLELSKAFSGPGAEELLLWLCENGHINVVLDEDPKALIEYNLILRLLNDAGFGILPVLVKQEEKKPETNVIDDVLESEKNG